MRRNRGRRTKTDPHAPPPAETLEPVALKICERTNLPRDSVRWSGGGWQYKRGGEWEDVPWYIYCVDPAREG